MALPTRRVAAPIIVFAFDRPHYLRRMLASLKAQRAVAFEERQIWLVQDGAVSARSGVRYAEDAVIEESLATFREIFPGGNVLGPEEGNLGIAFNILRGETLAFERLDAELAYFFEDDLELGPHYLHVLDALREATAPHPEVGYFAAYGDHRATLSGRKVHYQSLDHHWGFGLRRSAWRRVREWLKPYYAILRRGDYAPRVHLQVFEWLRTLPVAIDKSSQDAIKALACADLGIARIMTDGVFARYIGEKGASFNEQRYRDMGYDQTQLIDGEDFFLAELRPNRVRVLLEEQRNRYREFRANELEGFLAKYGAKHLDPDRMVTRDDIDGLYRAILDRLPEGEHIYEQFTGKRTLRQMRAAMLSSREFKGRNPER